MVPVVVVEGEGEVEEVMLHIMYLFFVTKQRLPSVEGQLVVGVVLLVVEDEKRQLLQLF